MFLFPFPLFLTMRRTLLVQGSDLQQQFFCALANGRKSLALVAQHIQLNQQLEMLRSGNREQGVGGKKENHGITITTTTHTHTHTTIPTTITATHFRRGVFDNTSEPTWQTC